MGKSGWNFQRAIANAGIIKTAFAIRHFCLRHSIMNRGMSTDVLTQKHGETFRNLFFYVITM